MREGRAALSAAADAGGDPLVVAIVAWECCGSRRQDHPALTAKRREHLERYCRIADQLLGAGAGIRYLLDVMHTHELAGGGEQVCSLDYFVCDLRRFVRAARRAAKGRPPIPHEKAGWWFEREERRAHQAAAARLRANRPRRARRAR